MFIDSIRIDREALAQSGSYVANLPFVRSLPDGVIPISSPVTFFVGENGSGKSTLLEAVAIAAGLNPEGGSKNFRFSTRDSHSDLWQYLRLSKRADKRWKDSYFLRAESFFNVATHIEELDEGQTFDNWDIIDAYGGKSLHEQSHGESFFALMLHRFREKGLYILDEPEAALSTSRQIAMLHLIRELTDKGAQFLISTHSPILTACPGAIIWELGENGMRNVRWEETENYILTNRFLKDPEYFLE
ncbi:MAG: hypothetical protein E7658_09390 [Ruminococcaceae bacterium]|nr:hypothetical protein [Oscillospiraceae bacterium]